MNATQPRASTIPQTRRYWLGGALALSVTSCVHTRVPRSLCEQPAAVEGHLDPAAPGALVIVRRGADLDAVAARLTDTYHIDVSVLQTVHGLITRTVTDDMVARLRCEPDIESVIYNQLLKHVTS